MVWVRIVCYHIHKTHNFFLCRCWYSEHRFPVLPSVFSAVNCTAEIVGVKLSKGRNPHAVRVHVVNDDSTDVMAAF